MHDYIFMPSREIWPKAPPAVIETAE